MKELSIEEKARAYDEAIKKARYWKKNPTVWSSDDICQKLFPELVESEDEKIRKSLINYFRYIAKNGDTVWTNLDYDKVIVWLEKQGKQKPVDKIEPIFNIGDKLQYSKGCGTIMTIEKIENGEYVFANNMGHTTIELGNKWYLVEQKPADMSIKEKAHQIAWETSKHYDPLLSKESWCEMAALDMAYWLEKQGEQKPVDEAEPKFRIGDKIRFFRKGTTNEEPMTITKIDEKGYWSDNLFICNFIDADRRLKLVEQKSTDKVEPKFKVGDWVTIKE